MEQDSVSMTVVDVVARDKGVEPTDLPPLHGSIDPDALDTIVATGSTDSRLLFVEFEFAGRIVTIEGADVSVRQV